ncbi:hypothetical protein JHK82_032416 [Glycine max]|nr:hypothetical protein JHK85_033126 [Glycine max]KAG5117996.1 hypothetical protein JHK82_032416 [Glycine max]KAG5138984.1 hypothetical protein JHK84_032752 [Glycine max]
MVLLQLDPFLNELTSMFERSTKLGSVWVTLKRSSLKSKVQRNKLATAGEAIEYRCLIRATDGKKTISTSVGMSLNPDYCFNTGAGFENLAWGIAIGGEKVMFGYGGLFLSGLGSKAYLLLVTQFDAEVGPKDHQRFQASYATILKAHMTALKKRERKDKKKPAEADKREGSSKRPKKS